MNFDFDFNFDFFFVKNCFTLRGNDVGFQATIFLYETLQKSNKKVTWGKNVAAIFYTDSQKLNLT
jgi:hypothetical protein